MPSCVENFASTTQADTQARSYIWARWPAKPPYSLLSIGIVTKILIHQFYKLIAILRRQYHIILTASWEKTYSVLGEATEPNTEYIFSQRRQYNVVLPSQKRN